MAPGQRVRRVPTLWVRRLLNAAQSAHP
jgi:hypothetical protein